MDAPRTVRARARAELTNEITAAARRQRAADGAPALSLRAVARELGMVSSGLYRYFASRDELLTALIVDAYDAIGTAAEAADAACEREDLGGRWLAAGHAVRAWALEHPHEYALVYGSPVPGYRAPTETVGPASRVTLVLAGIVADGHAAGRLQPVACLPSLAPVLRKEAVEIAAAAMGNASPEVAIRALVVWTQLFGMVSFELFGHFVSIVDDNAGFFDEALRLTGAFVGFPGMDSVPKRDRRDRLG
jgi:AcrR family transcriptional regulator